MHNVACALPRHSQWGIWTPCIVGGIPTGPVRAWREFGVEVGMESVRWGPSTPLERATRGRFKPAAQRMRLFTLQVLHATAHAPHMGMCTPHAQSSSASIS